jgi:hypothetical protein
MTVREQRVPSFRACKSGALVKQAPRVRPCYTRVAADLIREREVWIDHGGQGLTLFGGAGSVKLVAAPHADIVILSGTEVHSRKSSTTKTVEDRSFERLRLLAEQMPPIDFDCVGMTCKN